VTTGRIWLAGKASPLEIQLSGDCLRDLAGYKLYFTNRAPQLKAFSDEEIQAVAQSISTQQTGVVGDISGSRRVEVSTLNRHDTREYLELGLPVPSSWTNQLYIEWFSKENGRVVIEANNWKVRIENAEAPSWEMSPEDEQIQMLLNMQAMRDFISGLMRFDSAACDRDLVLDEVTDKYAGDPEISRKQAYVLGWDQLSQHYTYVNEDDLQLVEGVEYSVEDDVPDEISREAEVLDLCFELKLFSEGVLHQIIGVQHSLEQLGLAEDTLQELVNRQGELVRILDRGIQYFEDSSDSFDHRVKHVNHQLKVGLVALNAVQQAWLDLENNIGNLARNLGPLEDIFEASFELREEILSVKEEIMLI